MIKVLTYWKQALLSKITRRNQELTKINNQILMKLTLMIEIRKILKRQIRKCLDKKVYRKET